MKVSIKRASSVTILVSTLLLTACASGQRPFHLGGTSREAGLPTGDPSAVTLYLSPDLKIEYLETRKTEFHGAGTVLIQPGEREITLRYENSVYVTEYFPLTENLPEGSTWYLEAVIAGSEREVRFLLTQKDAATGEWTERKILGTSPLVRKSDNDREPILTP